MRNLASSYGKGASVVACRHRVPFFDDLFIICDTSSAEAETSPSSVLDPHPSLLFILNQKVITNALGR